MILQFHDKGLEPFRQPWRKLITVGRAYDLLRTDLVAHLAWLQREIGYEACRFHAMFHDDMDVVRRGKSGDLVFQWHHVDKICDTLLNLGLKPFIELHSMPGALASGDQTMFHYAMNVTPPRDWSEWGELVSRFGEHLLERYGISEIRSWKFEVWNEPNLPGFWSGSREDYWMLYEISARALKQLDPGFCMGGPATSKGSWVADFLNHCAAEAIPVDFVSTHLYPQDEQVMYGDASPHAPGDFFMDTVRAVQSEVERSALPRIPIHWTEWNTQSAASAREVTWVDNVHVDNAFAATFIARNCIALDDACESFGYWVASDVFEEAGIPSAPFSSTYGLLTLQGIPKASARAFQFLRRLDGRRLEVLAEPGFPHPGAGAAGTTTGNSTRVLLWNHGHPGLPAPEPWTVTVQFPRCGDQHPQILAGSVSARAGSAYEAWEDLGRPGNLTRSGINFLHARSYPGWRPLAARPDPSGEFWQIDMTLEAPELVLIEVDSLTGHAVKKSPSVEVQDWDLKMGERSR